MRQFEERTLDKEQQTASSSNTLQKNSPKMKNDTSPQASNPATKNTTDRRIAAQHMTDPANDRTLLAQASSHSPPHMSQSNPELDILCSMFPDLDRNNLNEILTQLGTAEDVINMLTS